MLQNKDSDFFLIQEVDIKEKEIVLLDFIFEKRCIHRGDREEILFYEKAFNKALDNNIYLFVEYDMQAGKIIR